MGKKEGGRRIFRAARLRALRENAVLVGGGARSRSRFRQTKFLGSIAAERTEMLAGAPLDGDRLISPGRARAGVDPARILQHIREFAGALNFDRLPIGEIGHRYLFPSERSHADVVKADVGVPVIEGEVVVTDAAQRTLIGEI